MYSNMLCQKDLTGGTLSKEVVEMRTKIEFNGNAAVITILTRRLENHSYAVVIGDLIAFQNLPKVFITVALK